MKNMIRNLALGLLACCAPMAVAQTGPLTTEYLTILPQNSLGEGGEMRLKGSAGFADWQMDVMGSALRLHTAGRVKFYVATNGFAGMAQLGILGDTSAPGQISIGSRCIGDNSQRPWAAIGGVNYSNGDGRYGALLLSTRTLDQVTEKMRIDPFGNVGIGVTSPAWALDIARPSPTASIHLARTDSAPASWYIHSGRLGDGSFSIADDQSYRLVVDRSGNVGIGTTTPLAELDVNGTTRTRAMELTGGADIAEAFDVAGEPQPGMVVRPDPDREGALKICAAEYDRAAVGVVSGAGGIVPATLLRQEGTVADGAHPVAMLGRVYVLTDASLAPIKPGDELTSSTIPGHAMKATDDARANRAVLGTALTSLSSGRGLVLIALQRR
jgi:hypothetical protein